MIDASESLKNAFVLRGSVKVKVQRVSGQVYVDDVRYANHNRAIEFHPSTLNDDFIFRERDVVLLRFFENGFADFVFVLLAVTVSGGLIFDGISELIVVEVRRRQLGCDVNCGSDYENSKKYSQGAHSAPVGL